MEIVKPKLLQADEKLSMLSWFCSGIESTVIREWFPHAPWLEQSSANGFHMHLGFGLQFSGPEVVKFFFPYTFPFPYIFPLPVRALRTIFEYFP
jgi:hypothetical protein